jgi:uncharacterized protein (DUF488 family)
VHFRNPSVSRHQSRATSFTSALPDGRFLLSPAQQALPLTGRIGSETMPAEIFTTGYEGRSVREFVGTLKAAGIARVVDVRELPLSRKRGFSKTALGNALRKAGIEYDHRRELGNPKRYRDLYKAGKVAEGERGYRSHIGNGARLAVQELAGTLTAGTCLLCVERDHATCHRNVIADELRGLLPGLRVRHL